MSKRTASIWKSTEETPEPVIDKGVLGFIADVLYIKGIICYEEFEDMMEAKDVEDLGSITEKLLRSDYNVFKRGEGYISR